MSTLDVTTADVRAWYDRYLEVFASLASGERTDFEALLAYFGAPLVTITDESTAVLPTRETVLSLAETVIEQLRQANYAESKAHRLDIRSLNARAALIEAVFSRHDRVGTEFDRFGTVYLVARTDEGWRFTTIAVTAP